MSNQNDHDYLYRHHATPGQVAEQMISAAQKLRAENDEETARILLRAADRLAGSPDPFGYNYHP